MAPGPSYSSSRWDDQPVIIDVGCTAARQLVLGSVVAGVIGLIAVLSGLAGQVEGSGEAVAVVIGALFLLPGSLTVAMAAQLFRPRRLVLEPKGVQWDDPKGTTWAVAWRELAAVAVSKHTPLQVGPQSVSDELVDAASDRTAGERAQVRLDLYPADPFFANRHREMANLWERHGLKNGYRLPLDGNVKSIPTIDQAIRRFAPNIYRGVHQTEGFTGLG